MGVGDQLIKRRVGFLNMTSAVKVPVEHVLSHYIAAASDTSDAQERVSHLGARLLSKRCALDAARPAVNVEDSTLVCSNDVPMLHEQNHLLMVKAAVVEQLKVLLCRLLH